MYGIGHISITYGAAGERQESGRRSVWVTVGPVGDLNFEISVDL